MHTARGGSALLGVVRVAHTLFGMSEAEAVTYQVDDDERRRYVRLDESKNNYALDAGGPAWLYRDSVTIANGDEVGVLTPVDLAPAAAERHREVMAALLKIVKDKMTVNAAALELVKDAAELVVSTA